jgi:hypothetical protein
VKIPDAETNLPREGSWKKMSCFRFDLPRTPRVVPVHDRRPADFLQDAYTNDATKAQTGSGRSTKIVFQWSFFGVPKMIRQ